MPEPVLILGGEPRIAVTIARSLHRRGIPASVAAFEPGDASLTSRTLHESFVLPSYRQAPADSLDALVALLRERRFDMLMPVSDTALGLIADHHDRLVELVRLACPAPSTIRRVLDKDLTLQTARNCGLPVPQAYDVASEAELDAIGRTARFPLVARPRDKSVDSAFKAQYLRTLDDLRGALNADPDYGARNIIQEFAPGDGVGLGMLMHQGSVVAMFQHRRLHEFPATGGVSVKAVAEPIDPLLSRHALTLLEAIQWEGVAMVEFKFDRRRRCAMLMEVNGRYWGSLSLAVQAGVDFPYYEWQIRHGRRPSAARAYRTGMKWRWVTGDLLRLREVFRTPAPHQSRRFSKWAELAKFAFDFRPGMRSALWSMRDPGPAVLELSRTLAPMVRDTAVGLVKSILPRPLVDRLRVARSLEAPIGRIYLVRQAKRALRLHRDGTRALPPAVRSVLVVCHGNIIRSPVAAALLRARVGRLAQAALRISSAGTHASTGTPADPRAVIAAQELGLDLNSHQAQRLTRELVRDADLVIGMDFVNEATIIDLAPEAADKTVLLGAFGNGAAAASCLEIADPYDGDIADVRHCYEAVDRCVTRLARELLDRSPPS